MAWLDRPKARGTELLLAAGISLGTGCTVLFDPNDLGRAGAAPDAPAAPDAASPIDVTQLALTSIEPPLVDEGTGKLRRVPVVLSGKNIAPDAIVRLSGTGFADSETQALTVSVDGTIAAFTVAVPVLPELGDSTPGFVQVEVFQAGNTVMDSLMLEVNGLDELVASKYGPQNDDTLDTDDLTRVKPKYANIIIDRELRVIGTRPLRLTATSEIVLDAPLQSAGQPAAGTVGGAPGAGGCKGGDRDSDGACPPAGGSTGSKKGGGGGGGHATAGVNGATTDGGAGGGISGNVTLVPLESERGGGGGGGSSDRGESGGGGGGSGGTIELFSLGDFTVRTGARLVVQGGAGADCGDGASGSGGGGSGGAILLRAHTAFADSVQSDILDLEGGAGGAGASCTAGGAGAPGRARVDAPTLPQFARADQAFHGAVLSLDTPSIVRTSQIQARVLGQAGGSYTITGGLGTAPTVTLDGGGQGAETVTLAAGINRVCAVVQAPIGNHQDGENCLLVAYVPE